MKEFNIKLKDYDELVDKYSELLLRELTDEFGDESVALYLTTLSFDHLWLHLKNNPMPNDILIWLHANAKHINMVKEFKGQYP